jgi:predicted phage replisome organizer
MDKPFFILGEKMSTNKKYYYLKFKENYFDQDHIKVIESMQNGYEYSLIILKLYLKSLKFEGQLRINEAIPYTRDKIDLLAGVLGHKPAEVMHAVNLAKDLGMIDFVSSGEIFMTDIQNFIGQSSTEGDRKREYRKIIEDKKVKLLTDGTNSGQMSDNRPPELELELELEKDIDLNKETSDKSLSNKNIPNKDNISDTSNKKLLIKDKKSCAKRKIELLGVYGEFENVFIGDDESYKLEERYDPGIVSEYIEKLSCYIEQNGRKYKNHYATLLCWLRKDNIKKKETPEYEEIPIDWDKGLLGDVP